MSDRSDVVTFKGDPLTLEGASTPDVGDTMPAFTARTGLGPDSAYGPQTGAGAVRVFNVVPSLDTPVCSTQTKRFSEGLSEISGVQLVTVSKDLPVAQGRWCGAEGVEGATMVSDYYDGSFGNAMGLRIKELGVLARSVFVVDGDGKITYRQIVGEVASEPDYDAALAAAKALV